MEFKVVCINDGIMPNEIGGFSINNIDHVKKGLTYTVEYSLYDEGLLCYKLKGLEQIKRADRFAPIQEQRERINYVAVSETLREVAIETVITQTN